MRISVINLTHGLLSDQEVITALRAINRQIAEDFKPYWNAAGTLRLEGVSTDEVDVDSTADMQGEAIIYLWDKSDVPDALGYHDSNYRGIPYGFVFVDIATEIGEDWTVTLSHEALELVGDRQANQLVRGPDPRDRRKNVYHWHEMCDAVQDETYEIDGIAVSNFVLPLYFTKDSEPGSRNDFLGTRYRLQGKRELVSLPSFGINPGGYIGFYDPRTGTHETVSGPDIESAEGEAVVLESNDRAAHRRRRKNKAGLARRGNRYRDMGQGPTSDPIDVTRNRKKKLTVGERKISIRCKKEPLSVTTEIPPLAQEQHMSRGYFAHNIYASAPGVDKQLRDTGFSEIAAVALAPAPNRTSAEPQEVELGIDHAADEMIIALVEVDGILFWQQAIKTTKGGSEFLIRVRGSAPSERQRRAFLLNAVKTVVRFIRHKIVGNVKEWITDRLDDYLAETIEKLGFRKKKSARLDEFRLLKQPKNKKIGEIKALRAALKENTRILLFVHGIFSSTEGAFGELLLNRWNDELLKRIDNRYDKIIGFDHWTVAKSTLENAVELFDFLPDNCHIDIVCHSRGAGVTRCLLEHPDLATKISDRGINVGKVIFAAGACQGSPLANPNRIETLTNVFAALSSLGGSFIPLHLFTGLLKAVQYGVNKFPGIQSMSPNSPIFDELNKEFHQPGCRYVFMRSNYEPRGKLKQMLDEIALDDFVFKGQRNDGVVPFSGAGTFDPSIKDEDLIIKGPEYGAKHTEHVFHTQFFEQREVRNALIEHLAS